MPKRAYTTLRRRRDRPTLPDLARPVSPALRKALNFLESCMSGPLGRDGRLPSTKQLADSAGVSFQTMWKAVRTIKEQGLVECFPGQGIFVTSRVQGRTASGTDSSRESIAVPATAWRRTTDRIAADIMRGIHRSGATLPTNKELRSIYGVSFATLRKSLAMLMHEGLIAAHGAQYRVTEVSSRQSSVKIVAVYPRDLYPAAGFKSIGYSQEGLHDVLLRNLEEACSRSSIALDVVFGYYQDERPAFYIPATHEPYSFAKSQDITGILYLAQLFDEVPVRELSVLAALEKPLAVFDASGALQLPDFLYANRLLRMYRISSGYECGRDMARYLLEQGHRTVAYFSPYHALDWSRQRFEGLSRTLMAVAGSDGARCCVLEETGTRASFVADLPAASSPDRWTASYREWAATVSNEYAAILDPLIDWAAYDGVVRGEVYRRMAPSFAAALSDPAVTAWVGANDFVGMLALDFLARSGRQIPRDLSVAGFDDSYQALKARLTSYSFDIPALVNAMLRHVMRVPLPGQVAPQRITTVPGRVVTRQSVARQ